MILIIIGIITAILLLLFLFSACKVSSKCSRIEEQYELEEK